MSDLKTKTTDARDFLPKASPYTLGSLIGKGGLGSVYRAEKKGDFGFSKPVAIKFLNSELSEVSDEYQTILHEAEIVSKLIHPNVIQILEIGRDSRGLPFLVMELIDGLSLDQFLNYYDAPLPLSVAVSMTLEIARSLQYIHQDFLQDESVIHCDVSLQNILFHEQSLLCKLTDFGFAKKTRKKRAAKLGDQIIGNPYYISPEHAQGNAVTPASDLYSLGIILSDLLFANRRFDLEIDRIAELAREGDSIDRDMYEELSPRLRDVLSKMVARKPKNRIQTAEEVITALEAVALEIEDFPRIVHQKKRVLQQVKKNVLAKDKFPDLARAKTRVLNRKNRPEKTEISTLSKLTPKAETPVANETRVESIPAKQIPSKVDQGAIIARIATDADTIPQLLKHLKLKILELVKNRRNQMVKRLSATIYRSKNSLSKLTSQTISTLMPAHTSVIKRMNSLKEQLTSASWFNNNNLKLAGYALLGIFSVGMMIYLLTKTPKVQLESVQEVSSVQEQALAIRSVDSVFTSTQPLRVRDEIPEQASQVTKGATIKTVRLKISVSPWGTVKIVGKGDNNKGFKKEFAKSSVEIDLKTGSYEVTAKHPRLGTRVSNINLGEKPTETLDYVF